MESGSAEPPTEGLSRRCGGAHAFAVYGGAKDCGVGGEALEQEEVRGEAEDGEALAGRSCLEVLEQLLPDIALILESGVEGVEEEDVERGGWGCGGVVGEDAGWQREGRLEGRWRLGGMLVEGADLLRLAFFEDGEVCPGEAVDGVAGAVGDDDVFDDEVGAGLNGGGGGLGGGGWGLGERGDGREKDKSCEEGRARHGAPVCGRAIRTRECGW